ncbi:MAG: PKD domain-containing protein [Ferruginibacter sp.]|nr:PKD domain-containing protein [Ferruginibacter sp.]
MKLIPAGTFSKFFYPALFFFSCVFSGNASAQLQANFSVDKQAGCSPLNVKFTNTTTGGSAATTWQWNFGNSNTSALKDPGATYFAEKTYTVTLTAKDGATTSIKSIDITVYKKPVVDFTVSPPKGCAPLAVNFTANANPGDGTIANYLWDFGDGATLQGSNYSSAQHTYTFPQVPPITLNVTNSYGCYATVSKPNQVEAVKAVQAAFTPSVTTLCNVGESVSFLNTSTGSGTLSFAWDFGDGKTSVEQSPTHVFTASGSYFVTLTTTSSDGCSAFVKSVAINVANFSVDFDYPATICLNQYFTFNNKSTKPFSRAEWWIDNNSYPFTSYGNGDYSSGFSVSGEHTIKLVVYYGTCSVTTTKKIIVNEIPKLNGFIAELQGACGVPVTINFKDTSNDAVSWSWKNNYYGNIFASTKNAAYTYTSGGWEYVYLTVTNALGCSKTVSKYVNYDKPNVYIRLTNSSNGSTQGCTGLTLSFAANPDTAISGYKWNFGDGSPISIENNPTHIFNTGGSYTVRLDYTTNNGCNGTTYYNNVIVVNKPVFDFISKQGTTICGNTPDTITATPALGGWYYYWSFNADNSGYYYGNSTIIKQFSYDTTYTVTMIAVNSGCRDTVTKKDYIKVLPPFPRIQQVFNTCNGTRGDVRFTENSRKALKWSWDFGDGGSDTYTFFKDTIRHTYTGTKAYKVVLTATNGGCTVRDSTTAYVLLKQNPLLTAQKTDACGSDIVSFKLSGYEVNPYNYLYNNYYLNKTQYGDLTTCNAPVSIPYYYWQQEVSGTIASLDPGKNDLRMITTSYIFGCADTSNFIPIRIHGPKAGFKIAVYSGCFKDPVQFTDTSQQFGNAAIVKWEWDFGDGKSVTLTTGGSVSHTYSAPGYYYARLKVTDADGCTNQSAYNLHYITVSGPKADFSASAYNVPPNTTVFFSNTSLFYNYYYSSSLQWIFSDSTTSTNQNPSFTFNLEGVYTVRLVTKNLSTGCTDTIKKTITVRKVNSVFTYRLSYINNNSCPPVIATFTSISTNAVRVAWNFGDGGIAGNQQSVSHTYNKPGVYRVVHYSYDSGNGVDSTEDFIEVKGPYAFLKADALTGCSSLQVTLTADVKNATDYTWDFGDGTVVPTTDTFAVHTYLTPGIYVPAIILKNPGGCTATSELAEKIIVDSLSISFRLSPGIICDSAFSNFIPQVKSLSNDQLQALLQYTWIVKEGTSLDTLYGANASHYFNTIGTHAISLGVETPYGCVQNITDSVIVKAGVNAAITGPVKLCKGDMGTFSGTAIPVNAALQWKWNFGNGNLSGMQYPSEQQFNNAGMQQISLVVSNGSCSDTADHMVLINPLPVIGFLPATPFVCSGSVIRLMASGGINYQWTANTAIANANTATITSTPNTGIFYSVKVTDIEGCNNKDSVFVKVIDTVKVTAPPTLFACLGSAVQLNVSGADQYQWINNTAGITNTGIANPSALSNSSVTYTVVGYDNYNCFSDTGTVYVRISNPPLVNAGAGRQLIAGTPVTLSPIVSGAVNWTWSPPDYLDCTSCLNPVSKPKSSLIYTLTAYNADGCKASDTVNISLICGKNLVYIPNAFSPNHDNLNDRFTITGSGIKIIRSVTIYNRWGKLVFERKNININDRNNSWDGYYNGEPMPSAAYVYSIQAECEGGDIFDYRGTVMILR